MECGKNHQTPNASPFPLSPSPFLFLRPNIVYVASNHFVWRLVPVSIATQIRQLLPDKQFELALQLAVRVGSQGSECSGGGGGGCGWPFTWDC